jgi:hypothetical protein
MAVQEVNHHLRRFRSILELPRLCIYFRRTQTPDDQFANLNSIPFFLVSGRIFQK